MPHRATGTFEGTGRAEMLSVGTAVEGSAGYVAIDWITGTLHGRKGTFVLQHSGLMARGEGTLRVVVVPDSGTDELVGLSGCYPVVSYGRVMISMPWPEGSRKYRPRPPW
jgi:hypothetical protein